MAFFACILRCALFAYIILHRSTNLPKWCTCNYMIQIELKMWNVSHLVEFRNLEFCLIVWKNGRRCLSLGLWFLFCCKYIYSILLFYHTNCNSRCLRKRLQLFFVPCLVLFTKYPKCWKIDKFQSLTSHFQYNNEQYKFFYVGLTRLSI